MKVPITILTLLFFYLNCISQNSVKAKLITHKFDNLINIDAIAENERETLLEDYSYLFLVLKKDENNNYSKEANSGNFSLAPKENKKLYSLKVSIQQNEEFKIFLFLRKDDLLVSKDSLLISSVREKKPSDYIEESSIEIKGLIIEDVKTKLGRDFYEYLYQNYLASGSKYPFIINILEKPSLGRGGKIAIIIDDRVVFEFITQPNDEFIMNQANRAMLFIKNYAFQRKMVFRNKRI